MNNDWCIQNRRICAGKFGQKYFPCGIKIILYGPDKDVFQKDKEIMETITHIWSAMNWVFAAGYFLLLLFAFYRNQMAFWEIAVGVYVIDYVGNWGVDKMFFWGEPAMSGAIAFFAFMVGIILWTVDD
jgi:hypothetical protein